VPTTRSTPHYIDERRPIAQSPSPMQIQQDVVCPTLVGRDPLMAAVHRLLTLAREGTGRVALIVGEAGVGKSRLLRAMTQDARAAGFFTLTGASFESERSIPYAPLLDLVRLLAASSSAAVVSHVLAPAASELVTIFPELKPLLPDARRSSSSDPESDKRRLFHALAQTLTQLARTQPVLVAFEDVHWTDDATLELIFHLARSLSAQPVIIALTYRGEEVGPRLARLIADLERARLVNDLPVERLGRDEVGAMLGAIFGSQESLGEEFVHLLHGLTEGNPFFVEETLKALITAGDLTHVTGGWRARPLERVRVPRTAVEAVRRRLASLTEPAREVAAMAAVAGRRFDFDLLQALTNKDERELLSIVKELIAAQLVVEESAERFAFRHALTREAIYAELLARERVALHRQVAAALERAHAGSLDTVVEALAYHAWEAGEWERAGVHAERAARHAFALSAPREAAAHLDRAFAAAERLGHEPSIDLHRARARAYETLGEFQKANADFTTALTRARATGDGRIEWESLHALGMLWAARDYSRAGEYRRTALNVARSLGDETLVARSLNRIGNWHVNLDESLESVPYHEEALAIFERLGDRGGVAETVDLIAMAYHCGGVQRVAVEHYERSVELFTALDERRGLANALALLALSGPSFQSAPTTPFESPRVREELRVARSVRTARDIGWRAGETFTRFLIANCLGWRGDYDRAFTLAREALSQAEEIQHLEWTAGTLRLFGVLALDLAAPEIARRHLEEAYRIARKLGSSLWTRWNAAPLAIARAQCADVAGALEVLEEATRLRQSTGELGVLKPASSDTLTLGGRLFWLARAEIALIEGNASLALEIADARLASERVENPGSALGVPKLWLVKGEALAALERFESAEEALGTAREQAVAQGAQPLVWRVDAALGHAYRLQRKRLEARRAFDAARALAEELASKVPDEELRSHFVDGLEAIIPSVPTPSPSRIAKEAFGGLTQREREVAELVAQGKANKAIGKELGIGERTVEGYVASALGKLGFESRTQLAAWVVEKGMVRR
jgi:DNA-binding CsgD family transcriptional regulator